MWVVMMKVMSDYRCLNLPARLGRGGIFALVVQAYRNMRGYNVQNFPEEMNRRVVDVVRLKQSHKKLSNYHSMYPNYINFLETNPNRNWNSR